jgi:uncharacterized protein YndB with AHSA1/START domain
MERETIVHLTVLVDASPDVVWRTLADPRLTRLYRAGQQPVTNWGRNASLEWRDYTEGQERLCAKGIVMAFQPGARLRYTHLEVGGDLPDEPASYTTVDISLEEERDGRTKLMLWQGDFAGLPHDVRRAREAGRNWVEALVGLKRTAEEQQGLMAA